MLQSYLEQRLADHQIAHRAKATLNAGLLCTAPLNVDSQCIVGCSIRVLRCCRRFRSPSSEEASVRVALSGKGVEPALGLESRASSIEGG
jgi:hypothetical protein